MDSSSADIISYIFQIVLNDNECDYEIFKGFFTINRRIGGIARHLFGLQIKSIIRDEKYNNKNIICGFLNTYKSLFNQEDLSQTLLKIKEVDYVMRLRKIHFPCSNGGKDFITFNLFDSEKKVMWLISIDLFYNLCGYIKCEHISHNFHDELSPIDHMLKLYWTNNVKYASSRINLAKKMNYI